MSTVEWLAEHVEEGGDAAFRIGRCEDDLIAEWSGLVRLIARRDGTASRFEPYPGADPRELEKVARGSGQLLLRELAGKIALHGAAVAKSGRGVVLLGRSGQGKSTLAAAICRHDPDAELFADDAVAIEDEQGAEPWSLMCLERHHWIDADARSALGISSVHGASGKEPVVASRTGLGRPRLVAFVDLAFTSSSSASQLTRIGGIEAMAALVPQSVRFVLDEPGRHKRELDVLAALVQGVPVFRLERPRALGDELLRTTSRLILDLLMCDGGSTTPTQERGEQ